MLHAYKLMSLEEQKRHTVGCLELRRDKNEYKVGKSFDVFPEII